MTIKQALHEAAGQRYDTLSALQSFEQLAGRPTLDQPIQPDPALPLWRLAWEDDRTDLPGVGSVTYSGHVEPDGTRIWTRTITCHCGRKFTASGGAHPAVAEDAAFAELVAHARTALLV